MAMPARTCVAVLGVVALVAFACESSGAGGRKVELTQRDDGCMPTSIAATPGEKLDLVIKNDSSHDPFEVEGIEGAAFEELAVPEGKTRSAGYTVPNSEGVTKLKCYVPGDVSTIIEVVAGGGAAGTAASTSGATAGAEEPGQPTASGTPSASVAVTLVEYSVTPDRAAVPAGRIRFTATNASASQVHELAVLKVKDDGSYENLGEIEDIDPGNGGSVTVDMAPGAYVLACLITKGEAGSEVDHFQQGMHTPFTVTAAQ
jgi:hypothetical protein